MSTTEKTSATYEVQVRDGLAETNDYWTTDPDKPWMFHVLRTTTTEVHDKRGKRHQDTRTEREVIAQLTVADAVALQQALGNEICYALEVSESRVLNGRVPVKEK